MGVQTLIADTDAVSISTPYGGIIAAYPFTVAGWVCPLVTGTNNLWIVSNTGNTTTYYAVFIDSSSFARILSTASGTSGVNAVTVGQWWYLVARFISATNRRLTVLEPNVPAIEEIQNTTSSTSSGWNTESIGANRKSSGSGWSTAIFAEWWRTNSDIQPGGAALGTDLLFQLAYKGPWSVSSVAEKIVWYKSFLQAIDDTTETLSDPAFARNGRAGWTQIGTPILGPHPPLASDYVRYNYNLNARNFPRYYTQFPPTGPFMPNFPLSYKLTGTITVRV